MRRGRRAPNRPGRLGPASARRAAPPRLRRYAHGHTLAWSAEVERCDAFVLVTPEYNHGPSAAMKNALDYLHAEWAYKAVGFVGYGGVAAGARAVQALRQVALALRLVPVLEAVQLAHIKDRVADGRVLPDRAAEASCSATLEELRRMDGVLRPARAQG